MKTEDTQESGDLREIAANNPLQIWHIATAPVTTVLRCEQIHCDKNVDGRDHLVAERDVVFTYTLCALRGVAAHLAFKGGTCLRKTVFGSAGRFSEDLDFTLDSEEPEDDVLVRIVQALNREHYGVKFSLEKYYKTDGDSSFGGDVLYRHAWNNAGKFRLQVSLRQRPTLPVALRPTKPQAYFPYLKFDLFEVRALEVIEMMAEKVRAAFQRTKVRDLYDLHHFATTPFDVEVLRRLAVLKLWQVRDPFDPDAFLGRMRSRHYDWDDLRRLIRTTNRVDADEVLATIESRYGSLRELSELERMVVSDARNGRNDALAERLRAEIRLRMRSA